MKTFTIIDKNKPWLFFSNCVGCILEPKKYDQLIIYTASGNHFNIGPQLPHDLCFRMYEKVMQAAEAGGTVTIPDMDGMNEDMIRVAIDEITIA